MLDENEQKSSSVSGIYVDREEIVYIRSVKRAKLYTYTHPQISVRRDRRWSWLIAHSATLLSL